MIKIAIWLLNKVIKNVLSKTVKILKSFGNIFVNKKVKLTFCQHAITYEIKMA